ncbi:MAG: peptidase MA family metallohydrolase [Gemmatimonadota bacterium]|nr:peptidase MA family metallohydrolase [Gemmatimonadota bacterium]
MTARPRRTLLTGSLLALLGLAAPTGSPAQSSPAAVSVSVERVERGFVVGAPNGRPIAFHFAPRDSAIAARLAETARAHLPNPVGMMELPADTFAVVIAPTESAFYSLTGGRVPDWGLAVAFPGLRRVVVRSPSLTGSSNADPAVVLRHELNHLYLDAATRPHSGAVPRWFNEGFSALYANEWRWVSPYRLAWARITGSLTPLEELHDTFPDAPAPQLAYIQSMAAVRSLEERGGDEGIALLLRRIRDGQSFDAALRATYGMTLDKFYDDWESELGREYNWTVALSDERGMWIVLAIVVVIAWVWRRRRVTREIERRKKAEDAALGEPDDHSLGVEEQDRYWEWDDDDAWRGEE